MSGILQALLAGGKKSGGEASVSAVRFGNTETTSFTLTSVPANCLVILSYSNRTTANQNLAVTSAGWTEVADLYANDTYDINLGVSMQYFDEGGNKAITLSHACKWRAIYIEGAVKASPLSAATLTASGINSPRPLPPTITVPEGSLIVAIGAGTVNGSLGRMTPLNSPMVIVEEDEGVPGEGASFSQQTNLIAVYDDSRSGLAFSRWLSPSEDPTADSWAAVTMGIR